MIFGKTNPNGRQAHRWFIIFSRNWRVVALPALLWLADAARCLSL